MKRSAAGHRIDLAGAVAPASASPFDRIMAPALASIALVAVFVVGGGVWSVTAPLESAAIAAGALEAESSRKTIQHLEGGIITQILVRDGDEVTADQPLLRLDDTKARTTLIALLAQLWDAQARERRLITERDGLDHMEITDDLRSAAEEDATIAAIVAGHRKIFETRRDLAASRVAVLRQRIAQFEKEIIGLAAQEAAAGKRAEIIKQEVAAVMPLVAKGLERRPRLLALEREETEIEGRRGEAIAQIARAQQAIGEAEAQILKLRSDTQNEVAQELRDTQNLMLQLTERIQAATDILSRTEIRAPEAGTITDLRIHTPGGVIAAGEPLTDLVPKRDRLIVRAQVRPEDVDLVRPGLTAQVRLLPYKQRRVPALDGVLTYVSADRLVDKRTEQPYFAAKIQLDEAMLRSLQDVDIMPGMPVEVLIKTGRFTVARYALSPILDSFNRAFREN